MGASSMTGTRLTAVAPMFLVDDVTKTAEWYRDALGFEIGEYYREERPHEHDKHGNHAEGYVYDASGEPFFVIITRDEQRLMLGKTAERGRGVTSNHNAKEFSYDAYFWADDVEPLFAYAQAAGATFIEEPVTRFYGMREFVLRDCDGRVLTFGAPVPA